ncbi:MAG: hypothetical protein U0271_10780 [Polyangiaceae bacterium]
MKRVLVRYTVKPEALAENERLVQAVFAELAEKRPDGLRYATSKQRDGFTFVHIATVSTLDGKNPLVALEAFKAFTSTIQERCVEPPVTLELEPIAAYGDPPFG